MTRSKWFRIGVVAVAAVAVLGLLVGTFQFVQDDQNSAAARPEECEGSSAAAAEFQECREALLLQDLDVDEPAALGELDDAARIRVATALCAQGAELGDSREAKPLRDQLFVIEGPGDYEVSGILVSGVRTFHDSKKGAEMGKNTVYVIHMDDVVFCHLGDLGHELTTQQLDEIGNVDVLFIPVGGGETISPATATSVISQIEPRVVVPMHYALDG